MDKKLTLLITLVSVAVLGWLDYITGFEITFSFFYLLPISLAAWHLGVEWATIITTLSTITWTYTNWLAGEAHSSEWIRFFNAGIRWVVFLFIALTLTDLKALLQRERTIARTDYLTGIFNKREFFEQLALEIKLAGQRRYSVSFGYIDLDNFKQVNDQLGHSAGDEQLKLISNTIAGTIRKTDLFARLGGDEFGLFLPNVDQEHASPIFEKIHAAVLSSLHEVNSPITLSIGVVTFQTLPHNVDEMIREADTVMYEAKTSGKNRIAHKTIKGEKG